MHVDRGHKFACWYLSRAWVHDDVPAKLDLADGFRVERSLHVEMQPHWWEWLGSLAMDELRENGLAFYVTTPSVRPEILDDENEVLKARCNDLLNALFVQEVPSFTNAILLSGARIGDEISVRNVSRIRETAPTHGLEQSPITIEQLRRAELIAGRFFKMQSRKPGAPWERLLRCTRVLLNANRTRNDHGERFHQFVRMLDGITKTRPGSGASDFTHRVQTFAVANEETRQTLIEMYTVRSAVEHVNAPHEAVNEAATPATQSDKERQAARLQRVDRLTRQADALARFALVRILNSETLFTLFSTEAEIDRFWALRNDERQNLWGSRLDIRAVA